jgi:hypothetical protein
MIFSFLNALIEVIADAHKLADDAQKRYAFTLEG